MSSFLAIGALAGSLAASSATCVSPRSWCRSRRAGVRAAVEIRSWALADLRRDARGPAVARASRHGFTTSARASCRPTRRHWVRRRVLGIYTLLFFGGTARIGAPLIGWAADRCPATDRQSAAAWARVAWTPAAFAVYRATRDRSTAVEQT